MLDILAMCCIPSGLHFVDGVLLMFFFLTKIVVQ